MRRVRRLNPDTAAHGQGELFPDHRHHVVFTDSRLSVLDAEAAHRDHAVVEQVIADLRSSALAHLPSGRFTTNAAWTVLATIAFNLTLAGSALASTFHASARTATIRRHLVTIPARAARAAGARAGQPPDPMGQPLPHRAPDGLRRCPRPGRPSSVRNCAGSDSRRRQRPEDRWLQIPTTSGTKPTAQNHPAPM